MYFAGGFLFGVKRKFPAQPQKNFMDSMELFQKKLNEEVGEVDHLDKIATRIYKSKEVDHEEEMKRFKKSGYTYSPCSGGMDMWVARPF